MTPDQKRGWVYAIGWLLILSGFAMMAAAYMLGLGTELFFTGGFLSISAVVAIYLLDRGIGK